MVAKKNPDRARHSVSLKRLLFNATGIHGDAT